MSDWRQWRPEDVRGALVTSGIYCFLPVQKDVGIGEVAVNVPRRAISNPGSPLDVR